MTSTSPSRRKLSPRTVHHVHTVLGACLKAAMRKGLLTASPVARAEVPSPGESDRGIVLDEDQLRALVDGFRGSVLFPIVAVAAFTGARRNEILALRWSDLDVDRQDAADRARGGAHRQVRPRAQGAQDRPRQAHHHDR